MPSNRRATAEQDGPRVLKKYPNRRLYDTQTSAYITIADVKQMVLGAEHFEVRDAKTGEDLTRSILLQIILEEESGGLPMFSSDMLANIIRFYGHALQGMMGSYLENNLQAMADLQTRMADQAKGLVDPSRYTPEAWTQLMGGQAFGQYLERSQTLFTQMQEQMRKQAETLLGGFGGVKKP